ncbi:MAG TPA: response regulator, partial [Bacteroidia bacterium]|nr:response regulator [Bacteroidia bacterium]
RNRYNCRMNFKLVNTQKILLVDDEDDILEILSYNFKKSGYDVLIARNGLEGYRLATEHLPDIIVTDLWMPDMDGLLMCKHIRDMPELDHSGIIVLTADTDEYKAIAALNAGADEYVHKPISPMRLVAMAREVSLKHKAR